MNKRERYESLLEQFDDASLFHQVWWLDAVYGHHNWDAVIIDKDGSDMDALPYSIDRKAAFKLIRPGRLTPYLANLDYTKEQNLGACLSQLPPASECIVVCPAYQRFSQNILREYRLTESPTYILSLKQSPAFIFEGFSRERKRHIRKAEKLLEVREGDFHTGTFITWHQKAFREKGATYPLDAPFIDRLLRTAQQHDAVYTASAFLQDECIGQIATFYDRTRMYYLLGAFNREYASLNAMSLLMYSAIIKAQQSGLQYFDFEGSRDKGIADFFSKFGAERKPYFTFSKTDSLLWKAKKRILG